MLIEAWYYLEVEYSVGVIIKRAFKWMGIILILGKEAYAGEGFSLKPDLIKSPAIKQLQPLTLQQ